MLKKSKLTPWMAGGASMLAAAGVTSGICADAPNPLLDKLIQKGILTQQEAQDIAAEDKTNQMAMPASKWKLADSIKSIGLFGDVRFRYEYRGVDNPKGSGLTPSSTYYRERFRYALRFGIKGDLFDNWNYGIRLETSANPRSPWVTFADDNGKSAPSGYGGATPSDKSSDGINIGQAYLGWHPSDWYEMTVGRMPMPLYTTPMVWDSDICPEGAFEKLKFELGQNVDFFTDFGQFVYQNTNPGAQVPSSDTFLLAWQVGANVKIDDKSSFKIAPMVYNYTGHGSATTGTSLNFVGQGNQSTGLNVGTTGFPANAAYNENGINDLLILEVPAEYNLKLGNYHLRGFEDFAYNFDGDGRARAAFKTGGVTAFGAGAKGPFTGENKAYQVGIGFGPEGAQYGPTGGIVYGSYSKKGAWEARAYWQHVEQYALDANLLDSDFFEGRGNLEGVYAAFSYCITDAIIGTARFGHAERINHNLDTGGNNFDIPQINPIQAYNIVQLDLTWRF